MENRKFSAVCFWWLNSPVFKRIVVRQGIRQLLILGWMEYFIKTSQQPGAELLRLRGDRPVNEITKDGVEHKVCGPHLLRMELHGEDGAILVLEPFHQSIV